jgi:hypothetical protein
MAGRSRFRIPAPTRIFFSTTVYTSSGAHPASYTMGTWYLSPGVKRQGREFTTQIYLVSRVSMSEAVPLLPSYDSMTWTGILPLPLHLHLHYSFN